MSFKYSKFQKYAINWLTFFSVLCFVNSILVIKFGFLGDFGAILIFTLPFAHMGLIIVPLFVYRGYAYITGNYLSKDEQYIKSNHPDIWKKIHPRNDYTFTFLGGSRFIKGRYDDGSDDQLNQIKFNCKVKTNLMCWPFLLILVVWLFNLLLIFL